MIRAQLIAALLTAGIPIAEPAPPPRDVRKPEPRNDAERIEAARAKRARRNEKRARIKASQEAQR